MKLSAILPVTLASVSVSAAIPAENQPRASSGTCSIGIGRESGSVLWDVTVYNCPQPQRQDVNIMGIMRNAHMDKGETITVENINGGIGDIAITNVDNAPVFNYDLPDLKAPIDDPWAGKTRVKLDFEIKSANLKWTTDDCGPGSVIFSAGRESWTCEFPCATSTAKEL